MTTIEKIIRHANATMDDDSKMHYILRDLAEDEKAFDHIMSMLKMERSKNKDLINELNAEYETAVAVVVHPDLLSTDSIMKKRRMLYRKYDPTIGEKLILE